MVPSYVPDSYIYLVVAYKVSSRYVAFSNFSELFIEVSKVRCAEMEIDEKIEQRVVIKFLVKSGKTNAEIRNMLSAVYGNNTMSRSTLYEWIGRFREGRTSVTDDAREGRPVTARSNEKVAAVRTQIDADRRKPLRDVASSVGISHETVRSILRENFNMSKVSPHMVPRVLTDEQKHDRIRIVCDWLVADESEDIFSRVITGDESWVFEYDLSKKRADMVWLAPDEPRVKKARKSKSQVKVMATVFFDCRGLILLEWMPTGSTITGNAYVETMRRLRERIRKKRPELWRENAWILHHDNAPAHRSFIVSDFLARNRTTVLEHPPYSPDLAPCDFFLFDKIKDSMRGTHLGSQEEIKSESARLLKAIPEADWARCFESWKNRMRRCIAAEGDYFEGDRCYKA